MFQNPYSTFKPYVVGTQKNRLSETILLSTHSIGFDLVIREILWGKRPIHSLLSSSLLTVNPVLFLPPSVQYYYMTLKIGKNLYHYERILL